MSHVRQIVADATGQLMRNSRNGDNPLTSFGPGKYVTDANGTLTAALIAGGLVQFSGQTAGRTMTTDTAVNLLATMTNMDIGDMVLIMVSNAVAFAVTWAAGTGVTIDPTSKATLPASSSGFIGITKTSATTVTFIQL